VAGGKNNKRGGGLGTTDSVPRRRQGWEMLNGSRGADERSLRLRYG